MSVEHLGVSVEHLYYICITTVSVEQSGITTVSVEHLVLQL